MSIPRLADPVFAWKVHEIQPDLRPIPNSILRLSSAERIKGDIYDILPDLKPSTVLELDFGLVDYVDAMCGTEIVVNLIYRLRSHEYKDIFLILSYLKRQPASNIAVAVLAERLAVVVKTQTLSPDGKTWIVKPLLLGYLPEGIKAALLKVMELESATARELQIAMDYETVNAASANLSYLYAKGLVARRRGGARRYRYYSILQPKEG